MDTEGARRGMDPALYKAATQGDVANLRKLVEEDVKILNSKTPQDNTALHLAALHGHAGFVREVLAVSEELMVAKNADGDTALHLAAKTGRLNVAKLLVGLARAWPHEFSNPSEAAEDTLLKNPLAVVNREGNNPLHEAVRHRRSTVAVVLLEADPMRGHDLNKQMKTPLKIAAREGLAQVVKAIADYPLIIHEFLPSVSLMNSTALHEAVLGNHHRIVEILLEKWPQLTGMADSDGNNALHYAAQKNNHRAALLLLDKRVHLAYTRNGEHQSPLHVAACYGSTDTIRTLLRYCSDVAEMEDGDGRNAFHASVASGKTNVLRCLLRLVRPVELLNRVDINGDTPLHLATKMNHVHSVLLLLSDKRVDPCLQDRDGHTARSLVEKKLQTDEMDTYEVYLWEQLKQQEFKRAKGRSLPPTTFPGKRRPLNDKDFDKVVDAYFLAATLIATVTFASTFTMPGGYDQAKGIALHGHNSAFKMFVLSNSVAMCSSIVVVFLLIWARQEPAILRLHYLVWSQKLTIIACLAMLLSLMTAVYITVAPTAPWPAYAVIAIGISSPGLFFVISWMGKAMIHVR